MGVSSLHSMFQELRTENAGHDRFYGEASLAKCGQKEYQKLKMTHIRELMKHLHRERLHAPEYSHSIVGSSQAEAATLLPAGRQSLGL